LLAKLVISELANHTRAEKWWWVACVCQCHFCFLGTRMICVGRLAVCEMVVGGVCVSVPFLHTYTHISHIQARRWRHGDNEICIRCITCISNRCDHQMLHTHKHGAARALADGILAYPLRCALAILPAQPMLRLSEARRWKHEICIRCITFIRDRRDHQSDHQMLRTHKHGAARALADGILAYPLRCARAILPAPPSLSCAPLHHFHRCQEFDARG
jgi:hypothetical protein